MSEEEEKEEGTVMAEVTPEDERKSVDNDHTEKPVDADKQELDLNEIRREKLLWALKREVKLTNF